MRTITITVKNNPKTLQALKDLRQWQDNIQEPKVQKIKDEMECANHENQTHWMKLFAAAKSEGAIPRHIKFEDYDIRINDNDETILLTHGEDRRSNDLPEVPAGLKALMKLALIGATRMGADPEVARFENEGGHSKQNIH